MKKLFTLLALCACMLSANAQTTVKGSRFFDNWSIGLDGGVSSNFHDWDKPNGGVAGIQFTKGVTPVLSVEISGQMGINDNANWNVPHSSNVVDNFTVMGTTKINLMNWLGGYPGKPRVFEMQVRTGAGYMRFLHPEIAGGIRGYKDVNRGVAKVGLDLDFNLGKKRAWTFSVRPAIVFKAQNGDATCDNDSHCKQYTHNALGQLTGGLVYHFKNSNGEHYFTKAELRDQSEIDRLNEEINAARAETEKERENARRALDDKDRQIRDLQQALRDCEGRAPVEVTKTVTNTVTNTEKSMECYVYFGQGRSTIDNSQMPNVERIATFLRNHKDAKVEVNGYASPEGSVEINERLARQRAEAVKTALVNKYKIDGSRINAIGKGVGDAFSEPDWNRVSICTIQEK